MKKILFTAVGMAIACFMTYTSPKATAQVFGEYKSITLVENKPYEEINGTNVSPSLFALPPNYIGNDRNDGYVKVNLGFDFEFNGEIFHQAWISTNGFITLSAPPNLPAPNPQALFLEANNYPNNVIAPYWGDHYLRDSTDFFTQGFVPSSISYTTITETDDNNVSYKVFVVQWKNLNINYLVDGTPVKSSVANFQVRLYESKDAYSKQGNIEFCYGTIGPKNRPDITDTRVITKGAVVGIKGEGKMIGEGADYLNALYFDKDINLAGTREDKTSDWQPSGGSDKRILLTATVRFNVAEWWGDGDVDFSKAIGNKHYNMSQSRFVTANDARLILKSVVEGLPLDPVRRRAAYHADVNHNGRYYYNGAGEKVNIKKKSKIFTDDLPNEISSVKQILFQADENDAAWIMLYLSGRLPELPWVIDTFPLYGKLTAEYTANNIKVGSLTKLENGLYEFPVYLNNYYEGPVSVKFDINGALVDVLKNTTDENELMLTNTTDRVVISGYGKFEANNPIAIIKVRLNDNNLSLRDVRFNGDDVASIDMNLNNVEIKDASQSVLSNTPNPISSLTTINVNVNESGYYSLNIYDLSGNVVKSLYAGEIANGVANFDWNLLNNNNQKVNPGVYMLRLEGNGLNVVKKLIVEN
ncbi:MAG TPA: T9SS type A sorting domain-containing protein [Candidatus Kapabacteria bacterium]|nr:T9SS type A sorting domain-containing protein [Candidatus Kapabacteria bacterium]